MVLHRWSNLNELLGTVEVGVGRGVDGADVFDGFGSALVAVVLELFLALLPIGIFVDVVGLLIIHNYINERG